MDTTRLQPDVETIFIDLREDLEDAHRRAMRLLADRCGCEEPVVPREDFEAQEHELREWVDRVRISAGLGTGPEFVVPECLRWTPEEPADRP
jgi:hypothetical protein